MLFIYYLFGFSKTKLWLFSLFWSIYTYIGNKVDYKTILKWLTHDVNRNSIRMFLKDRTY